MVRFIRIALCGMVFGQSLFAQSVSALTFAHESSMLNKLIRQLSLASQTNQRPLVVNDKGIYSASTAVNAFPTYELIRQLPPTEVGKAAFFLGYVQVIGETLTVINGCLLPSEQAHFSTTLVSTGLSFKVESDKNAVGSNLIKIHMEYANGGPADLQHLVWFDDIKDSNPLIFYTYGFPNENHVMVKKYVVMVKYENVTK